MTTKQSIINRIVELLEALKTAGTVREVQRVTTPFLLATILPSIHLVIGPEENKTEEEELRGYVCEFPVMIKVTVEDARDPYGKAEEIIGPIQSAIEADLQLSGLAVKILYLGDDPFTNELNKPVGGNMVSYLVQYRRQRALPSTQY
jgi:hypothetical protein